MAKHQEILTKILPQSFFRFSERLTIRTKLIYVFVSYLSVGLCTFAHITYLRQVVRVEFLIYEDAYS